MHAMPNSWREREALRVFENSREGLRGQLDDTLASHSGDLVKARMAFEDVGRSMGLDLSIPSVSGRLHALFDLHVDINQAQALQDPRLRLCRMGREVFWCPIRRLILRMRRLARRTGLRPMAVRHRRCWVNCWAFQRPMSLRFLPMAFCCGTLSKGRSE